MGYCVYKHTAPNGKSYIGITSRKPEKRWRNGSGYAHNPFFANAIQKHGWNNIKHEILYSNLSADEAERKERELIEFYHSNDRKFGYNLTSGGEVGKRHAIESIEKMRMAKVGMYGGEKNPHYGKKNSEETRQKISSALTGMFAGEKNPNYGKPMSDEQKRLIGKSRGGKHYPKLSESVKKSPACIAVHDQQKRPVLQFTKDGQLVKKWASAADASRCLLGHRKGQCNICYCATGHLKSAYGFVWKYPSEADLLSLEEGVLA